MDSKTTTIKMTDEDTRLFILFQKHRRLIEIMDSADAFSIKGGYATLHFNNLGAIASVDVHKRYILIH